ncbi:MAG: hypothetical protein QNI97_00460 [Desulfobacterales bacterium]|nr:hypothetical protein [Desulfobacterales bacterium]MDJ0854173.1 hypothetical protein [Desulfobacterales bacterium]
MATSRQTKGQTGVSRYSGATIRYFRHYEELEDAFRQRIATLLPRRHAGTALFWRDFQRLLDAPPEVPVGRRAEHYITSDPRDCLAFGTPRQVLRAALMTWAPMRNEPALGLNGVVARFSLERQLDQPVRSLSGGETVRLALAKAFIAAGRCGRLTLASPFSWLSLKNRRYYYDLSDHYRRSGSAFDVFALEGEDEVDADVIGELPPGPDFDLYFRRARVVLGTVFDHLQDRPQTARIEDGEYRLRSPCLIRGDNGQGKSLVAKVLARAIPREGDAVLGTAGRAGRVRLLLQDLVNQTLMRRFRQLATGADAGGCRERVGPIYDAIRADMIDGGALAPDEVRSFDAGCSAHAPATLVELKILLTALRLASAPAALVMDEPDWGLRQASAMAFVGGVIRAAHRAGIPVLLISHKRWWRRWAGSGLQTDKTYAGSGEAVPTLFRIRLRRYKP